MIRSVTAALVATLLATAASAQDAAAPEATPFLTLTGTAAFVTDYRFRGISLSDRDIAGQASLTATTAPGFFVGIWGSTIESVGAPADGSSNGSEQEIDLTAGFTKSFGAITPSVGIVGYVYPGGKNIDYYELFGSVAGAIGPVSVTVGLNFAPDSENLADDNTYVYGLAAFGIPNTPITIKGSVGYEDGSLDFNDGEGKVDYMVGIDYKFRFLTLGLQYIGSDIPRNVGQPLRHNSKDGIVFSATAAF